MPEFEPRVTSRRGAAGFPGASQARRKVWGYLGLLSLTLLVYGQAGTHAFIVFDDPSYVTENPWVRAGLSLRGARWAFSSFHASNWHPITWLSHMADIQLFGLRPGFHHWVNVLFHAANALLLLAFLSRATGAFWRSAAVAAVFAVHPLHVESVAWVAERKDVLSTFCGLSATLAYLRYVRSPRPTRYWAVVAAFAVTLMAKPMLVTLPLVLLLLDYWPLGRLALSGAAGAAGDARHPPGVPLRRVLWEKVPLALLTAVSCVLTFAAQKAGGSLVGLDTSPLRMRLANVAASYGWYVAKAVWPSSLAVFYPNPGAALPLWRAAGGAAILAAFTGLSLLRLQRRPYLAVGWFWFAGMLFPVIGLVQVGSQSTADRYAYLPLVGLTVAVVWGLPELAVGLRRRAGVLGLLACSAVCALSWAAWVQLGHWKTSVLLFEHTLRATTSANRMAHVLLADGLLEEGRVHEGVSHLLAALQLRADDPYANGTLGAVLATRGDLREAAKYYRAAVRKLPSDVPTLSSFAHVLVDLGRRKEAVPFFREALRNAPEDVGLRIELADTLVQVGRSEEAVAEYRAALRARPRNPSAYVKLGKILGQLGRTAEAVSCFEEARLLAPGDATAHYNLAVAFDVQGRTGEAVTEYQAALRLDPADAMSHGNLGMALARLGRLDEAIDHLTEAVRRAPASGAAHNNLGLALGLRGRADEAVAHLREAARLLPGDSEVRQNLEAAVKARRVRSGG